MVKELRRRREVLSGYPALTRNRNRNLGIFTAPLNSQAHQGISLFTSAATNQRGFQRVVHGKLRPDFESVRRDGVAVKVGVV